MSYVLFNYSRLINVNLISLHLRQENVKTHIILFVFGMPFYAVAAGKVPGIYKTWQECQNQTKGYPQAKFRKFNTEAEASNFIKESGNTGLLPNTTALQFTVENCKRPELEAVGKYPPQTLLKQDKLSLLAKRLDEFIEVTNNTLGELSRRLDNIEASTAFRRTSESKRKDDDTDVSKESRSKKKRGVVAVEAIDSRSTFPNHSVASTRSKGHSTTGNTEVDSPWRNNFTDNNFIFDPDGHVVVHTDGACSNNGKNGAKAGIGVWFNHNNPFNVAAAVEGNATNNNAEIQAATRAIEQANLAGIRRLHIHTDSQFMINCITNWIKKWKKNNWVTGNGGPVKNKEQLLLLDKAIPTLESVKWTHVRGHVGIEGNDCADSLARSGATMY